jgi:TonB family protein
MESQHRRLSFGLAGILVLATLYIYVKNTRPEPPRPRQPLQIPGQKPEVATQRPSAASEPTSEPKPTFPNPTFADARAQLVRKVQPKYTQAARDAHYEGQVKVNFMIDLDGFARNIEIVNSPGHGMDQNIIDAVKQWRWDTVFIRQPEKATTTITFHL